MPNTTAWVSSLDLISLKLAKFMAPGSTAGANDGHRKMLPSFHKLSKNEVTFVSPLRSIELKPHVAPPDNSVELSVFF